MNLDFQAAASPSTKAVLDWYQKQFAKIGIQLDIRGTDYNRFQDKVISGNHQLFLWGWLADYPDAENFLFLLYGPNAKSKTGGSGENASNYQIRSTTSSSAVCVIWTKARIRPRPLMN